MHPELNRMLAAERIADLHRDAAQARLVHELREQRVTTRGVRWPGRVAAYLASATTRTAMRSNA